MKIKQGAEVPEARIDLTPMIDTVMFLLIFFMMTTTLKQEENDLGITLLGFVRGKRLSVYANDWRILRHE